MLRRLCGLAPLPGCIKPDITSSNIQFLRLEQERLAVEKVRPLTGRRVLAADEAKHCVCTHMSAVETCTQAPSLDPGMHHTWLLKQQQVKLLRICRAHARAAQLLSPGDIAAAAAGACAGAP